jgi:hypothetical protein
MTDAQIELKKITDHFLPNLHAGMLHRWHTHPHLAGTVDRLDGHQGRVAKILLKFWPDTSREALIWALIHDDGESATGDIPGPVKDDMPKELRYRLGRIDSERLVDMWSGQCGNYGPLLPIMELDHIDFSDKLDAYMWAKHHAPHIMGQSEWQGAAQWLFYQAQALGVFDIVEGQQ